VIPQNGTSGDLSLKPYFLFSYDQLITAWHFALQKKQNSREKGEKSKANTYQDVIILGGKNEKRFDIKMNGF
jgi:hypothetical protein